MASGSITQELEDVLNTFHESGLRSVLGEENARHGFWPQALYIGRRVANNNKGAIYLPGTVEDLLVVTKGETDQEHIEFVQVKSLKTGALHLSHLNPKDRSDDLDKDDSFFGHIRTLEARFRC